MSREKKVADDDADADAAAAGDDSRCTDHKKSKK